MPVRLYKNRSKNVLFYSVHVIIILNKETLIKKKGPSYVPKRNNKILEKYKYVNF